MRKFKQHISLFFLIFFISLKLVGLHEFTHAEEEYHDNCDICEYVITSNTTPVIICEKIIIEQPTQQIYNRFIFFEYGYLFTQNQIGTTLFCRPPPTA